MEDIAVGTNDEAKTMDKVPSGNEERETLVACGTNILKNVGDVADLKSIVELLQDLEEYAGMQEGLKSFQKNTQKRNYDSDSRRTPTSLSMVDLEQINLHLETRLDEYSIDNLGWVHLQKTLKPLWQNSNYEAELLQSTLSSSSAMLESERSELNSSSEGEGGLNYETHPFNIELIAKTIFKYVSVSDLKNCRLVSKFWRDMSLSFWRRKAVLQTERLIEDCDDRKHWKDCPVYMCGCARCPVQRFIKNGSKFMELPFQRYEIDSHNANFNFHPPIGRKKYILNFFRSSIQELALQCDDFDILSKVLTNLPELRVLHLELNCQALLKKYTTISERRNSPFCTLQPTLPKLCKVELEVYGPYRDPDRNLPWKKIFQSAPALKSFRLTTGSSADDVITDITRSILEIRQEEDFSSLNLKELHISEALHQYPPSVVEHIAECQFPIQTLRINLGNGDNPSRLMNLLEAHAETLHCIKCDMFSGYVYMPAIPLAPYFHSKVTLPNLKELALGSCCVRAFHLLCSMDVPNLESLRIAVNAYQFDKEKHRNVIRLLLKSDAFMSSYTLPNLKKFSYNEPWNFSPKELEILAKAMPNLTDLCIPLRENTFPNVYKLWPELQSLHILATELTYQLIDDYTITGIPFENYCDEVKVLPRGPNITDLKNLRKFVLETRCQGERNLLRTPRGWITDLSAAYGFLQLPELQVLQIESVCKFSPNVILALENHVSEMKIVPPDIFKHESLLFDAAYHACSDLS